MATTQQTIVIQCADPVEFAAAQAHVSQQQQVEGDLADATRTDDSDNLKITIVKSVGTTVFS